MTELPSFLLPGPRSPRVPAAKHRPLGSVFIGRPPAKAGLVSFDVGVFQASAPALELLTLGKCGAAYVNFSLSFFFGNMFTWVKKKKENHTCARLHVCETVAGDGDKGPHSRRFTSSLFFMWALGQRYRWGQELEKPCLGWPETVTILPGMAGDEVGTPLMRAGGVRDDL